MEQVYCRNLKEWRAWLKKNHLKKSSVSLIVYKVHTGRPSLKHRETMEEAICFGWIDTTLKRLDENRYIRKFARRSKNSKWSYATLGYAKNLIAQGKMSPEGLKRYEEGLAKPVHGHGIPLNPRMPKDLKIELEKNQAAKKNFNNFAKSYKRTYLRWLESAKLPETRKKRIAHIFNRAKDNKKNFLQ